MYFVAFFSAFRSAAVTALTVYNVYVCENRQSCDCCAQLHMCEQLANSHYLESE